MSLASSQNRSKYYKHIVFLYISGIINWKIKFKWTTPFTIVAQKKRFRKKFSEKQAISVYWKLQNTAKKNQRRPKISEEICHVRGLEDAVLLRWQFSPNESVNWMQTKS